MASRRNVLSGVFATGAALAVGSNVSSDAVTGASQCEDRNHEIGESLRSIQESLQKLTAPEANCATFLCPAVERIRENQKAFFKANGKLPDFIDIGIDIWERVCDWYIRIRQPVPLVRLADGRVGLTLMMTGLVVRHDFANDYIGLGYDAR